MRPSLVLCVLFAAACGPSSRNNGTPDTPPAECSDGEHRCSGSVYQACTNGTFTTQEECTDVCDAQLGCVACAPNTSVCVDGNVHSCDASGNVGGETMACTGSTVCQDGACVDACMAAAMNKSYIGCEYMAVDLDNAVEVLDVQGGVQCGVPGSKNATMQACGNTNNSQVAGLCDPPGNTCPNGFTCKAVPVCILDAQHSPFAIVVSNPQSRAVNVTITGANGATVVKSVPAGEVLAIKPQSEGIPDQSNDLSGKAHTAYKVTSDLPIVAYQFNPLDNVAVFSNDASLLIPRTAYDTEYYVLTMPTLDRRPSTQSYNGYVTVVAAEDNTIVEVTPTVATRGGPGQPAIAANTPTMFTLQAFDVLTLEAAGTGDLTGTRVRSMNGTTTFGVFGGHEATGFGETNPPDGMHTNGPCCADHLEEMLFPTSTWGKSFAITRSKDRGTSERDVLRILAQKANTTVTFDPPPAEGTCGALAVGKFCEVKIAADTSITASEPVLIGHFLESAIWGGLFDSLGEGDPSFSISVPVEQFRTDYTVLVPSQYKKNFLSISAGASGAVTVDGLQVQLTAFGQYRAARMQVVAGQHRIKCPDGCGVEVYGYDDAVSYMFAGGLDLRPIVLEKR